MSRNGFISYETVVMWLVPVLLSGMLGVLGWMGTNLQELTTKVAVVATQLIDHERRISHLEGHNE